MKKRFWLPINRKCPPGSRFAQQQNLKRFPALVHRLNRQLVWKQGIKFVNDHFLYIWVKIWFVDNFPWEFLFAFGMIFSGISHLPIFSAPKYTSPTCQIRQILYMRVLYCCKDNFHFQVHCYCSQKGVNRLKTLTLQGLFPFPLSLPSFPSPPLSSDLSLPSKELLRGPLKGGRPGLTVTMT